MTILEGNQAMLLAEGAKINTQIKALDKRFKEIKAELGTLPVGTYENQAKDKLVISETERFTDIDPKKVFDYLKKEKRMASFPGTVKVQITPLKKVIAASVFDKWRKPLDPIKRMSFK